VSAILLRRFEALQWRHELLDGLLGHALLYGLERERQEQLHPFLHDVQ